MVKEYSHERELIDDNKSYSREKICREFCEACGGHWHERITIPPHVGGDCVRYTEHATCSCAPDLLYFSNLETHIQESNPQYLHPDEVLREVMKWNDKDDFLYFIRHAKDIFWLIPIDYILEPDKLLNAAHKWLMERKA